MVQIEGKVYAALVMADHSWGANKPLFAGMVRLAPEEDGVTWKRLEAAVLLSGYHIFSPRIVQKDQSIPADAVKASFDMWIKDQKTKYESKSKKRLDSLTSNLLLSLASLLSKQVEWSEYFPRKLYQDASCCPLLDRLCLSIPSPLCLLMTTCLAMRRLGVRMGWSKS